MKTRSDFFLRTEDRSESVTPEAGTPAIMRQSREETMDSGRKEGSEVSSYNSQASGLGDWVGGEKRQLYRRWERARKTPPGE